MNLLSIHHLSKSFNGLQVLQDISLEVQSKERHVIIGPNGAGKTTLFNCITGMLSIDSGTILLKEQQVNGRPVHSRIPLGMARTFQKNNLFGNLSVEENVQLAVTACKPYRYQFFKPLSRYRQLVEETEQLLQEWHLYDRRNRVVNELSYGEQRLLEILLALASKPQILLLDEPTSGMSPAETVETTRLIQSLPSDITLLVIEHDMEVVFSIADRITVLHQGGVFISGTPQEVHDHEGVKEIYFGGGALAHANT